MPDPLSQLGLMPSILDRLVDRESGGTVQTEGYSLAQMTQSVLRDLEHLLNTRLSAIDIPQDCPEVATSIVAFGLPDFSSIPATTPQQRADIGRLLETIILRYEPRLREIKATLVETDIHLQRSVRFLLAGKLQLDPAPEVNFDTILELTTGHSTITPAESPGG